MGGGDFSPPAKGAAVSRYYQLLSSYTARDQAALLLFGLAAISVLIWFALDHLPAPIQSMRTWLTRIYSGLLLLAYVVILVACALQTEV
jgi:hypothetical protein